ncbi:MAG: transporter substrate-binding domain-containing protein [Sulfurospirillum sp.]|jgi:polar amino acid transport system substrate-binding protein|nr:transporter substrate-binding domain-containing protein [Sulfurospirillum sp. 'SP']WNY99592.1 transporter substrate-binding domain-containing protein [Sulfurospirillum sp. 'SP']
MRLRALTWYGVIFGWLGVTALLGADPVVYAGPNPPFNFRDKGVVQGLGFDLLEASLATIRPRFSQEEIDLDIWNKVYNEALAHPNSFLISTARLKDRESLFQWVGPLATVKLGAITKRSLVVPKGNTIEALRNLRIATIKETSAEQTLFKEIGTNHGLNITRVSTPIQGYKMLEYGRIDALVYTDVPFVYHLVSEGQDVSQYKMAHVLLNTDYYIAAGKGVPKEQINIMQTQLNRLKEIDSKGSSMYDRIVANYLKGAVLQP